MAEALPEYIEALLSPAAYDHPVDGVELVQTHISFVLLAGDFAYKLKKPLDLHFVDYSTLERRRQMCEEEVRLNRRLCPEAYLGVVPVTRMDGRYRIGNGGEVVEWAVQMVRMPADRMMPAMLARGEVTGEHLRSIAHKVATFHRESPTDERIASFGRLPVLRTNWDENFEQTAPFVGKMIPRERNAEIREYVRRFMDDNAGLIEQRADEGRTRDCHGDLRADSIVIREDGSICVMDRIEFNDRLRYGDVAADIGFLAMDLDFRREVVLADELMAFYLTEMPDETFTAVLHFYRCYRAYVRGKVESMRATEPEVPMQEREEAHARAWEYFRLAAQYAKAPAPRMLLITVGLSGSGKTHFAAPLAGRFGAVLLSSDASRRRVLGIDAETETKSPAYGGGIYSEEQRRRVYDDLHRCAAEHLAAGRSVVLDATYMHRRDRDAARQVAAQAGVRFVALEIEADEEMVRLNLATRERIQTGASEAGWEVYMAQRERFEPPDEIPERQRVRVLARHAALEASLNVLNALAEIRQ